MQIIFYIMMVAILLIIGTMLQRLLTDRQFLTE